MSPAVSQFQSGRERERGKKGQTMRQSVARHLGTFKAGPPSDRVMPGRMTHVQRIIWVKVKYFSNVRIFFFKSFKRSKDLWNGCTAPAPWRWGVAPPLARLVGGGGKCEEHKIREMKTNCVFRCSFVRRSIAVVVGPLREGERATSLRRHESGKGRQGRSLPHPPPGEFWALTFLLMDDAKWSNLKISVIHPLSYSLLGVHYLVPF